jgi:uncharacterized protein (TIGR02217 family)
MTNNTNRSQVHIPLHVRQWVDTGMLFEAGEVFYINASGRGGWGQGDGNGNPVPGTMAFPVSQPEGTRAAFFGYQHPTYDLAQPYGWSQTPYPEDFIAPAERRTAATIGLNGWIAYQCYPMSLIGVIKPEGITPSWREAAEPTAFDVGREFSSEDKNLAGGRLWLCYNELYGLGDWQNPWLDNYGSFDAVVTTGGYNEPPSAPVIDEVELDREICRESTGGIFGNSDVSNSKTALEQRQVNWQTLRRGWRVLWVARSNELKFEKLMAFYQARSMKRYGFRFYDWSDHDDWGCGEIIYIAENQTYQMYKVYPDEIRPAYRVIYKPIAETILVYADGILILDAYVDSETGRVRFPDGMDVSGKTLTWTGEFCIPARFDTNNFEMTITPDKNVVWNGVAVLELL